MGDYWGVLGRACALGDSFANALHDKSGSQDEFYKFLVEKRCFRLSRWERESLRFAVRKLKQEGHLGSFEKIRVAWGDSAIQSQDCWPINAPEIREALSFFGMLCIDRDYAILAHETANDQRPPDAGQTYFKNFVETGTVRFFPGVYLAQLRDAIRQDTVLNELLDIENNGWKIPGAKPCAGGFVQNNDFQFKDADSIVILSELLRADNQKLRNDLGVVGDLGAQVDRVQGLYLRESNALNSIEDLSLLGRFEDFVSSIQNNS
ncbi:MAG: hypothetical protein AAF481_07630 [Acidobacteriota bacterium]